MVVDDGSTDDTPRLLEGYRDRVRYIRQEASGGPSRPRNTGVAAAQGECVAFFDADDIMSPGAISDSVAVMERHPEVGFVFANSRIVDERGSLIEPDYLADYRNFRRILVPTEDPAVGLMSGPPLYRELLRANFIGTCGVVARKSLLAEAGPFDETLKNADDRDMWLRVALTGTVFAFVDRVHFSYRRRGGSVTRRGWRRLDSVIRMLEKHRCLAKTEADRRHLDGRINRARIARAYGLRCEGLYDEAAAGYREALRGRKSLRGLLGLVKTYLLRLASR
jgi:glycosyltransferase involved in cell wall biosynthesis